jgi:hypothetical protein
MAVIEHIDLETGEVTTEDVALTPVDLGGSTRLQRALGSAVRKEFDYVNDSWHPSIEQALVMTRDRSSALLKGLLAEAMQELNEAVKPKQMRIPLPDQRIDGGRR